MCVLLKQKVLGILRKVYIKFNKPSDIYLLSIDWIIPISKNFGIPIYSTYLIKLDHPPTTYNIHCEFVELNLRTTPKKIFFYISTVQRQYRNEKKKKISRIFCQHKISSLLVNCKWFTHIYTLGKLFQSGFFKFCSCFSYVSRIFSLHNIVSLHVKFCREIAGNLDFRLFVHKHIFLCSFFFFPRKLPKFKYL